MENDKRPKRSKDTRSPMEIKNALERTPDKDLIDEVFRRGLIMRAILFNPTDPILLSAVIPPELSTRLQDPAPGAGDKAMTNAAMGFRQRPRRKEMREHLRRTPVRQYTGDIDEDIARLKASASRHREYVGQLLDLLSRKRLDKTRERGIQRTDDTPEIAHLGMLMARTIFDHLVIARRDELDAGACDIESLWAYLMDDNGYDFASSLITWDTLMPPNLWASFICKTLNLTLQLERSCQELPDTVSLSRSSLRCLQET
jgi:hypothetical protein